MPDQLEQSRRRLERKRADEEAQRQAEMERLAPLRRRFGCGAALGFLAAFSVTTLLYYGTGWIIQLFAGAAGAGVVGWIATRLSDRFWYVVTRFFEP